MLCISGIVTFLFASMPCLSMVGRNNTLGYVESRQKVDSGIGVSLVLLSGRIFFIFFKKHIGRYSKFQLTSGNGRPKDNMYSVL